MGRKNKLHTGLRRGSSFSVWRHAGWVKCCFSKCVCWVRTSEPWGAAKTRLALPEQNKHLAAVAVGPQTLTSSGVAARRRPRLVPYPSAVLTSGGCWADASQCSSRGCFFLVSDAEILTFLEKWRDARDWRFLWGRSCIQLQVDRLLLAMFPWQVSAK